MFRVRILDGGSDMVSAVLDVELEYDLNKSLLFLKKWSNSMNIQSPTVGEL